MLWLIHILWVMHDFSNEVDEENSRRTFRVTVSYHIPDITGTRAVDICKLEPGHCVLESKAWAGVCCPSGEDQSRVLAVSLTQLAGCGILCAGAPVLLPGSLQRSQVSPISHLNIQDNTSVLCCNWTWTDVWCLTLQAVLARDTQDGERGGSQSPDVVLPSAVGSHLPVTRQQQREYEHGHTCHAACEQDSWCACPVVGICNPER